MDFKNNIPIYIQVINKIKKDIISGDLKPGDKMPSTRELAKTLGINPNTASRVYKEMEIENLCYTKRGLGTYITESNKIVESIRNEMAQNLISNYVNGMKELGFGYDEIINKVKNYNNLEV